MSYDFKSPNISAPTDSGKIEQIKSYLYQFVEQLKWAFNSIDKQSTTNNNIEKESQTILDSIKLPKIKDYSNKNFDELIYHTEYYIGTSVPSLALCVNYPIDEIGMLEVVSARKENITFTYQTYRTQTGNVYMRSYSSSSGWNAWKEVAWKEVTLS